MEMKEMNLMGIIALVGAILLVVGVFLDWMVIESAYDSDSATGWKIFDDGDKSDLSYTYAPLVALICGIISLVVMILPTIMNTEKFAQINNLLGLLALVLAIVSIVLIVLFMTQKVEVMGVEFDSIKDYFESFGIDFKWGIGFWLTLVGGIITAVGGLMPILKNKGIINF